MQLFLFLLCKTLCHHLFHPLLLLGDHSRMVLRRPLDAGLAKTIQTLPFWSEVLWVLDELPRHVVSIHTGLPVDHFILGVNENGRPFAHRLIVGGTTLLVEGGP